MDTNTKAVNESLELDQFTFYDDNEQLLEEHWNTSLRGSSRSNSSLASYKDLRLRLGELDEGEKSENVESLAVSEENKNNVVLKPLNALPTQTKHDSGHSLLTSTSSGRVEVKKSPQPSVSYLTKGVNAVAASNFVAYKTSAQSAKHQRSIKNSKPSLEEIFPISPERPIEKTFQHETSKVDFIAPEEDLAPQKQRPTSPGDESEEKNEERNG